MLVNSEYNPDITKYLYEKAGKKGIPLGGNFELTPLCNMNCKMCYIRMSKEEMERKGKEKSADEWLKIARQAKDAGMLYLLLTGGEPLLYSEFRKLFTELRAMGLLISINTNAVLIDDDWIEFFKKNPPYRINITLYGGSDNTYQSLCRCENGFTKAYNSIKKLKEAGIYVKINSSITPDNAKDIEACFGVAKEACTPCSIGCYMFPPTRRGDKSTGRFTPEEAGFYQAKVDKLRYDKKDYDDKVKEIISANNGELTDTLPCKFRCRAGASSFWITWDGKMNACGMIESDCLDPFKDGFLPCWEIINKKAASLTVLEGCKNCKDRMICKVCPSIALAETGDYNQKPEYLCRMLKSWKEEMLK